jgi:hypothetical protein
MWNHCTGENSMSRNDAKRPGRDDTGTPRWVKVFGIIVLVLVLLVAIIIATGLGGEHGPGRHLPPRDGLLLLRAVVAGLPTIPVAL